MRLLDAFLLEMIRIAAAKTVRRDEEYPEPAQGNSPAFTSDI